MRIVFFGSPDFAVPILRALAADPRFAVPLVVTQAAKGSSPVEIAAAELGLPVYKPETLRDPGSRSPLVAAQADLFVVAAFGLIFGRKTLAIPRLGSINVHPSLLPRFRGASPIMAAIECGDEQTGVTLMEMDAGLDTGAVVSMERVAVARDDTTESLTRRLADVAAEQACRDIPLWTHGEIVARPQATIGASLTRPLKKPDGLIDWRLPAVAIERHIRAMWPWPRAWTTTGGSTMQIHRARVIAETNTGAAPGSVLPAARQIVVACGDGALELLTIEPAGRRAMPAAAYRNGRRTPLERFDWPEDGRRSPLIVPIPVPEGGNDLPDVYCG